MWLLDTNTWIRYLNPGQNRVKEHLRQVARPQVFLCDIVKAELYYGAYKSQRVAQNLRTLEFLFHEVVSLPFDSAAAKLSGEIRAELEKQGTPIGPYDVQIAAIALDRQLTLVSHNLKEFQRIPGLRLEDWE